MSNLIIKNGLVYDPLNDIDGEKKDIYIKDGYVADKVNGDAKIIDASGLVVMPGGVDIHTHIAGAKVNAGRSMRPEDKVPESNMKRTKLTRSGTGFSVLSTWKTGYLYAKMGYTTCAEPAMPLLEIRAPKSTSGSRPNSTCELIKIGKLSDYMYINIGVSTKISKVLCIMNIIINK